ncbi:N-formylglutamate amidohydrolase [Zhengella sp. ZM62]|uniref:N-formylglutamate amidohydrolase n=1 Tax=Zhengella sedimenti TaxID=3390035 RepID=UPI00397519B6
MIRENPDAVAEVVNPGGSSAVVLVCEHASNFIPPRLDGLGISADVARSHVAWDPGADTVARAMAGLLDAALVRSTVSRLVYDCNRPPEAPDAIPAKSEIFDIPGNRGLAEIERASRAREFYFPFRTLLKTTLEARRPAPVLVTIHSFTPVYFGKRRAVEIGILHDKDARLADVILGIASGYDIRRNEPYGPADGVTHTLREHALPKGYPNVMIEVRNDLVGTPEQCAAMARMLAGWIERARAVLDGGKLGDLRA